MSVFQARPGPRAPQTLPLPDGWWFVDPATAVNAMNPATPNLLLASPWLPTETCRVDQMALRVTTGAAGAGKLGLYAAADRASDYVPTELLGEITADLDTSSAGVVVGTLPVPVSVRRGTLYWRAVVFSDAPNILGFSPNIPGGSGFLSRIGAPVASASVANTAALNVMRFERTAPLTYVIGSPFLPAQFGAGTYALNNPPAPLVGLRKAL